MSNFSTIILSTAILKDKFGRILLLHRSNKNKNYKNVWQFPEGKLEYGESFDKAISREIKEETGFVLTNHKLKGVFTSKVTILKMKYFLARVVFEIKIKGKIKLDEDHDKYDWFTKKEAKLLRNKIIGFDEILNFA